MSERMTPEQTRVMTGPRAANLLENILKWKLQLTVPQPGVRSTPTDTDGIRTQNTDALPFGLDQVIDTSWGDGPNGTTTEQGVDKWFRFWTPWFSYWAGEPAKFRMQPGPWMLKHLTENPVFTAPADWDREDQDAWNEYTSELQTMHHRLATLTGHKPLRRSLCPKCLTGNLQSPATRDGYTDTATCTNPDCKLVIDYSQDETAASIRAALRDPNINKDAYLTIEEIKTIWPNQRAGTLRQWANRGRVRKQRGRYNLADINQQKLVV